MMRGGVLDRAEAEAYATWFRCLADPTRIQILHLLASRGAALKVGEITALVDVGQSTVSGHLKRLAEVGFVLVEHVRAASWYRLNPECLDAFPSAAEVVMSQDT